MAHNSGKSGFFARRRWILWGGGSVAAVILLASFASRDDSVPVLAASVSRSTIQSVIATNGKVEPVNNFEAHAPVGTTVKRVLVKEGDRVRKGQLLVELDAAHARSQEAQALARVRASDADMHALERGGTQEEVLSLEAQLVKARDAYSTAARQLEALKRLEQSGAASPGEVRAAEDQLSAAAADRKLLESKQKQRYSRPEIARIEAAHSEAESAYSAASDVLDQLSVRAPFGGTVYAVPVKQGAYVNPGDLLVEEANLSEVLVRAFVDEPDVARLSRGEKTEITWDAMPGRVWQGTVTAIPAEVKLYHTRNVGETTSIVNNEDLKLLPNINVGVSIVTAEHAQALTIPREAVRQDDSVPYVYQIVNNGLHRQNVQTSISNLTKVEVTGGIQEGAVVALGSVNSKPLRDRLTVRVVH